MPLQLVSTQINEDEVLRSLPGEDERREYFQQIVTTANPGLAAFERVVNFAVLDRDFSEEQQELTAKGSYRRKAIEKNFADIISDLYQTNEQVGYCQLETQGHGAPLRIDEFHGTASKNRAT